ncbi:hypothetical protein HPB52_016387 [Rhipicephalus sanguineus]|uniref:Uncharacterized protein n=1 Tax=Rhipicephalus sanguineus TaxID=34632 RepID=A0A9D4Q1Y2_RHISA|nr:hypothetical protein HPB52_016387 [Rhipicephalus sanguineus]
MATAGVSRVRCGGGTSNRVQFNPAIDLQMLSSGTEEEYGEREALLQEILDLARESGVTIRAPRRANMPSVRPDSKAPVHNGATTAARKSAALARDDAAEMYFAESTGDGPCTDMEDSATHFLEGTASCDDYGDITSIENMHEPPTIVPEVPATPSVDTDTPARANQTGGTAADNVEATASTSNPTIGNGASRARRHNARDTNYAFLEKRLRHDLLLKEKDFALESRRLALQEERLAWKKERIANEGRLVAVLDDTRRE